MKKMKKKNKMKILTVGVVVFVLVIVIGAVVFLLKSLKTLDSIALVAQFAETELDTNQDYTFSVEGTPSRAKLKSLEYMVEFADSTGAVTTSTTVFKEGTDSSSAVLHTVEEGTITVYVKKDKIKSNYLTFAVVDAQKRAEEEAKAQAELEAAAAAEAEAAATAVAELDEENEQYAMVASDKVRMRAEPNTDCEIVRTCDVGESYLRIEEVDDWTKVDFNGRECYIKTEFVKIVTKEEAETAKAELQAEAETKKVEEEAEKKKEEEKKKEDEKKKKEEETKKEENAQATTTVQPVAQQVEQAPVAPAEPAAPVAPAGTVTINCKDGAGQFTKAEYDYFVATWSYTGMADEMMTHHSVAELHDLYNKTH